MKRLLFLILLLATAAITRAQLPRGIVLTDISGRRILTDTLQPSGKPLVIDFFATWCKPCLRELDAINELYADWQRETGVSLVAVSIDQAQNIQKVRPLVKQKGWDYTVLLDPDNQLGRALNVKMIPYTLILDPTGQIAYKHNGYTDGDEQELYEKILEIANKK